MPKDKERIIGNARNSSVVGNKPYDQKGESVPAPISTLSAPLVKNGVRKHKVAKTSVHSRNTNNLWKPNGYGTPRIIFKKARQKKVRGPSLKDIIVESASNQIKASALQQAFLKALKE